MGPPVTWNYDEAILGWLDNHPHGGTSEEISVALNVNQHVIAMKLVGLCRRGLIVKIDGRPPMWRLTPGQENQ